MSKALASYSCSSEFPSGHAQTCSAKRTPLASAMRSLAGRAIAYFALRSAEKQLQSLDDRTLKDIGIQRSEISSIIRDHTGERILGPSIGGSAFDVLRLPS